MEPDQHKEHEPKPDLDEVAKKAYDLYLKESRLQGRERLKQ